ncbi:putative 2OG-Fe(II) oxygenase [Sphingomonas sp. HDW15A]|uniref:putative 2OG-Fe(II) oxygenase n=1 Tax=Sphingomonas sp. HDW15A TaxID=2714942 RepID=UPI001F0F5D88|nr:putative 2OG-Fe(II) oxygenase [Sphingomonas sp. HDW15A]
MNLMAQLQQAQSLAQVGRVQEAWTILAPHRSAIDKDGQALRLFAFVASQAGKTDETIDALKRIVALENGPPEIIGALADTLGTAGRHAEAAEQWTRLARLRPDLADAHLNRAVSLTNAGNNAAALSAADEGLLRFPGHARLFAARGAALKNLGRIDEAVGAFDLAVRAAPSRPRIRYNQAVTLRAACRYDEACEAFAEAQRLGMSGSEFTAHWAAAELEAGHVDRAADLYNQAVAEKPENGEAMSGLTRLEIEYRDGTRAFDHYRAWAEKHGSAEAWTSWVHALAANKRNEEAAKVGREGISKVGRDPDLVILTAFTEGITGEAGPALAEIESLPVDVDSRPLGLVSKIQLAMRAGDYKRAAGWAEQYNRNAGDDQIGWSLLSLAWRMLDDPREHWLCDYERLVMVTEVPSPDGKLSAQEFAKVVAAALDPLHQTLVAPGNQSLSHGTQTSGALFDRPDPVIQSFREGVMRAAANAIAKLPDDPTHPFLRRKSTKFGFSGSWSVRLQGGGGHHVPHFHGHGWMSSAFYARLPDYAAEQRERQEGWIEFGRPPDMFNMDVEPRRIVEPQAGRLVLFPSFMLHGTRPFGEGRGDRLTAAFDYQPL